MIAAVAGALAGAVAVLVVKGGGREGKKEVGENGGGDEEG